MYLEACPRDTVSSSPDHHNKANTIIKWVTVFGFPVHVKITTVQLSVVTLCFKKPIYVL